MPLTRLLPYIHLMRLNKPIGILLLLWPTLWAILIASHGRPTLDITFIFIMGTLLMRSAGCVINDYADRHIDPYVRRTAQRPLASKRVPPKAALLLAACLFACAFLCILPLNQLTGLLSLPALFLAGSYPWTKRFLAIPQAYLGVAFSFGIPMAFAAIQNTVPPIAWLIFIANIFWVIAYDTEYAMIDREDDLKIGIKTAAITFGRYDIAAIMLCHSCFIGFLVFIGYQLSLNIYYFSGLSIAGLLIGYQYYLIRRRDSLRCFHAFKHNHWIGLSVFIGILTHYRFT